MGTPVRAAVGRLRALGPHASGFADYLSCNTKVRKQTTTVVYGEKHPCVRQWAGRSPASCCAFTAAYTAQ